MAHNFDSLLRVLATVAEIGEGEDVDLVELAFLVDQASVTLCALILMFKAEPDLTVRLETYRREYLQTRLDRYPGTRHADNDSQQ